MSTAIATASAEPQVDFFHQLFNPFIPLTTAAHLLQCSREHAARMARAGDLLACDLSLLWPVPSTLAMADRDPQRTLRVLRASVDRICIPALATYTLDRLRTAMQATLFAGRKTLGREEVAHALSLSPKHIGNLLECGALAGSRLAGSSGRLQFIYRDSLLAALAAREI